MYRVVFSRIAEKDLDAINKKYKPYIFAALFSLKKNPYEGKKLKGKFSKYHSLRISQYRIVYKIYKSESTIFIIRIGPRQGVYK